MVDSADAFDLKKCTTYPCSGMTAMGTRRNTQLGVKSSTPLPANDDGSVGRLACPDMHAALANQSSQSSMVQGLHATQVRKVVDTENNTVDMDGLSPDLK